MQVVDRRQFIIMDKPYIREDFKNIVLQNGMVLSYHKDLCVRSNKKLGIYLLGIAFSVNKNRIILDENCENNRRYWAGRWVLIYKTKLYLDCCGTLGCFYYSEHEKVIISSSLHLIKNVMKTKLQSNYQIKYGDGHGTFDYYPAPFTIYSNIFKLLPSQNIEIGNKNLKLNINQQYMIRKYNKLSREQIETKIIEGLACEMKNISQEFNENIWIPLTGGVDSRTNLALAVYSRIKFHTYTIKRNNTNKSDIYIPQKICKKLGIKNLFLSDLKNVADDRKKMYEEHVSNCSVGTEKRQILANIDIPNAKDSIILWGTVWESYIKYYYSYFEKGKEITERLKMINEICESILDKSLVHKKSIREWLEYVEKNPIIGLDWRERLYIEQRVGGWVSYAAQGFDLLDSVRISPVNCQELMELLLSLDVSAMDKSSQLCIINKCCPKISKIQYGNQMSIIYRLYKKIKRILSRN